MGNNRNARAKTNVGTKHNGVQLVVLMWHLVDVTRHLRTDDDTLAAGGLLLVDVLVLGRAVLGVIRVSASRTSAVKLDTVTSTGDAKALACAAAATRANTAGRARVGGAGGEGWDVGALVGVVLGVIRVFLDGLLGEAAVELLEGGLVVLGVDDLAGLAGALGLGGDDALWAEGTALCDGSGGDTARLAVSAGGRRLGGGDVDDVKLAAGSGLGGVVLSRVVGDVVAVDDVVVPVALALLEGGTVELEAAGPSTRLLLVLGERELALVAVPGSEKVDGLAVGGSAESEVKLDSGHCEVC
jgi:hypothetical protein